MCCFAVIKSRSKLQKFRNFQTDTALASMDRSVRLRLDRMHIVIGDIAFQDSPGWSTRGHIKSIRHESYSCSKVQEGTELSLTICDARWWIHWCFGSCEGLITYINLPTRDTSPPSGSVFQVVTWIGRRQCNESNEHIIWTHHAIQFIRFVNQVSIKAPRVSEAIHVSQPMRCSSNLVGMFSNLGDKQCAKSGRRKMSVPPQCQNCTYFEYPGASRCDTIWQINIIN